MTGKERIDRVVNLLPCDRIPVAPLIIGFAAACAGITQREIYAGVDTWMKALNATYDTLGLCDAVFPRWPRDVARLQMMQYRFPGEGLDDDSPAQAVEKELMGREGYAGIVRHGYKRWFFNHLATLWGIKACFPLCMPFIMPRLLGVNLRSAHIMRAWTARGADAGFDSACYPPFDLFSLTRSAELFFYDLADIPDVVEAAMRTSVDGIAQMAKMPLRFEHGNKICIYPMRSSASFISPDMFERFSFPYIRRLVEDFHKDGIVSVLHCDGNWTPMLGFLAALPPKSCIVELDGETDIFKAKSVLGDRLCLKGNVPAQMLAFAKKNEVLAYCDRLNREIGAGGGFILSSGCEVPINAKIENVKALVESVMN